MNRILELRNSSKLSQADLAKFVGCTQVAISHYEKGQRKIPPEVIAKLCSAFNVTSDYLLGFSDTNAKSPAAQGSEAVIGTEFSENAMRLQQQALSKLLGLNEQSLRQAISLLEVLEERQARQETAPEAQD